MPANPHQCPQRDSNPRHAVPKTAALPLSYEGIPDLIDRPLTAVRTARIDLANSMSSGGVLGQIRTGDLPIRSRLLYPLSYEDFRVNDGT